MPVVEKYKDMGTVLMGKVESGVARKTQTLVLMPNRVCFIFYDVYSSTNIVLICRLLLLLTNCGQMMKKLPRLDQVKILKLN